MSDGLLASVSFDLSQPQMGNDLARYNKSGHYLRFYRINDSYLFSSIAGSAGRRVSTSISSHRVACDW
jgi:hypothetical protein